MPKRYRPRYQISRAGSKRQQYAPGYSRPLGPASYTRRMRRPRSGPKSTWYGDAARTFLNSGAQIAGSRYGYSAAEAAYPYVRDAVGAVVPYGGVMLDAAKNAAAAGLRLIGGSGDYQVKSNTILAPDVPAMHSVADGVRIRHREYVRDISTSVSFSNLVLSLNPGLSETFPWLSGIAQNFEEYEWKGVVVELKSISSDAIASSTNLAMGTIITAAEYNVTQPAYTSKAQMENSFFAKSCKPSETLMMGVECDPAQSPLGIHYVRTGAVGAGQDPRLYDLCNVQVATVGSQAAYVVSELWITYDVVLRKPQLVVPQGLAVDSAHVLLDTPSVASPMGASRTELIDNIGVIMTAAAVVLPAGRSGRYLISYSVRGDSTAVSWPTVTLANCSYVNVYNNQTAAAVPVSGTTTTALSMEFVIEITDSQGQSSLTWAGGTLPANATYGDLIVTQVNGDFV